MPDELGEGVVGPGVRGDVGDVFHRGEKTSRGTMQPPSAASPRPVSSDTPSTCCSLRNSVPRKMPAPDETSTNRATIATTPIGWPQLTPNSRAEPKMITSAWTTPMMSRPSGFPGDDRRRRSRSGEHPPRDAEAPGLDETERAGQGGQEQEQQQLGPGALVELPERGRKLCLAGHGLGHRDRRDVRGGRGRGGQPGREVGGRALGHGEPGGAEQGRLLGHRAADRLDELLRGLVETGRR